MYEKYGEFNSAEELNTSAATALEQGDEAAVKALAKENGIDVEDAQDYIDGITTELCTPLMAAIGKLKVEAEDVDLPSEMIGWTSMINDMLADDPELAAAVRRKGKKMTELFGQLMKICSTNRKKVPKEICKAAGINGEVYTGNIDIPTFKETVRKYYNS